MKSIQEIIALSTQYLQERGLTRARRLVEELLSHVLQCKRLDLYLQFDRPVEEKELGQMRTHLARIAKGEPIEYVIGHVEFFGVPLQIDPRVFIPRQETEILADWVAKRLRGVILWDLCAGSGALGISLKKKLLDFMYCDYMEIVLPFFKTHQKFILYFFWPQPYLHIHLGL